MSKRFVRDQAKVAELTARFGVGHLAYADIAIDFLDQLADVLPITVHEGDVVLEQPCFAGIDVFTGNLTVRHLMDSSPMRSNYGAMAVVLGDLHVDSIVWDGGPLFVGGSLTIARTGYFTSDGFGLFVGRDLSADVFIQQDGGVEVTGQTRCRVDYRRGRDASMFDDSLTYEVAQGRRAPDRTLLSTAVRVGSPLLKT